MLVAALDREELRQTLAEVIDVEVAEVADDADFLTDLEVDSLMALEVVVVLEKKYRVKFVEAEMREVTTLSKAYALLQDKLRVA